MDVPPLVLASASPRRSDLLTARGVVFEICPSHADESLPAKIDPVPAAESLAERKARAIAETLADGPPRWVLGADTVVALGPDGDTQLLGKPAGPGEAGQMLRSLSGTRHRVVTGVCVMRTRDMASFVASECTWVRMRPILPAEVEAYVQSREWEGKAGGYAIQETADAFVMNLEGGGFDNVVGLPVSLVLTLLARSGLALPGS